jgi:hypothetical protein
MNTLFKISGERAIDIQIEDLKASYVYQGSVLQNEELELTISINTDLLTTLGKKNSINRDYKIYWKSYLYLNGYVFTGFLRKICWDSTQPFMKIEFLAYEKTPLFDNSASIGD